MFFSKLCSVYEDGKVCISILHPPGEDKFNEQESAMERWRPILGVEQIIISVMSMLSDPNDFSPANIDAAVRLCQWHMLHIHELYQLSIVYALASLLYCCRFNGAMTSRPSRRRYRLLCASHRTPCKVDHVLCPELSAYVKEVSFVYIRMDGCIYAQLLYIVTSIFHFMFRYYIIIY